MALNRKGLNSDDNILADRMDDRIKQIDTSTICKVISVNTENKTVSVLPMVQMNDLNNNPVDHALVNDIPYIRLQAGSYGIICDPVVGDIGLVVFCSRDISNVIKNKKVTTTGSKRTHSISDGIYVASLLLEEPKIYLKIIDETIEIKGNVTVNGNITATGDIVAGKVSLQNHIHSNGNNGGNTGKPSG
ncbi:Gp138 family membrane-puncturing spike protein [Commensalibacter communis]|uniref:Gp138 family membrane-puncturing spike protein n=1 Tax=Commensalibacter communis TaxID=2972786 RepID=UPI0022FF7842|nr:Gp138 family membrane-puncturing spike protein [Commensalibacter communis]CAI3933299.1 unnamed protein product [Commensalibacter communis]CAI3944895.1 unnamed protein product [Commensalibacter communis]